MIRTYSSCLCAWVAMLALACGARASLAVEGEAAPRAAAELPEWAVGMLVVKSIGEGFDALARYCDKVADNSGALARRGATSRLFPLPIDEGLDPKAPAAILRLLAGPGGGPDEEAYVLPVADVEKVKRALADTFGGVENEGRFKAIIPQGFPLPDKELLIRVDSKLLLAAPSEAALKKLEEACREKGAGLFLAPRAPTAQLTLNLGALRRQHRKRIQEGVEWASALASACCSEASTEIQGLKERLLRVGEELERLDLSVDIQGDELTLSARLQATPDTELSMRWDYHAAAADWELGGRLPADATLFIGLQPKRFAWNEQRAAELFGKGAAPLSEPRKAAQVQLGKTLAALLAASEGGLAAAIRPAESGGQILAVFGTAESTRLEGAFKDAVRAGTDLATVVCREGSTPVALVVKDLPAVDVGTATAPGVSVDLGQATEVPAEIRQALDRAIGWPLTLRYSAAPPGLWMAFGKDGEATLKRLFPLAQTSDGVRQGGDEFLASAQRLPKGTAVWVRLRPVAAIRPLLGHALLITPETVTQLVAGLSDAPVQFSAGTAQGTATVQVVLPAPTMQSLRKLFFKLQEMGLDPTELLQAASLARPDSVPAPPPPEP